MTLSSRHEDKNGNLFGMDAQGDALDDMRVEASGILQMQYERCLLYTSLLFFCCFGCHRGEKPAVLGFSTATGSATG